MNTSLFPEEKYRPQSKIIVKPTAIVAAFGIKLNPFHHRSEWNFADKKSTKNDSILSSTTGTNVSPIANPLAEKRLPQTLIVSIVLDTVNVTMVIVNARKTILPEMNLPQAGNDWGRKMGNLW